MLPLFHFIFLTVIQQSLLSSPLLHRLSHQQGQTWEIMMMWRTAWGMAPHTGALMWGIFNGSSWCRPKPPTPPDSFLSSIHIPTTLTAATNSFCISLIVNLCRTLFASALSIAWHLHTSEGHLSPASQLQKQ